ncbi:MAG: phytase, partial [Dehalococcoidia bacterium]
MAIVIANLPIGSQVSAQAAPAPPPDFKVAFIGDQGIFPTSQAVLQLIQNEGAQMVLHMDDLGYGGSSGSEYDGQAAQEWEDQINGILGNDFPYFATAGNHDVGNWDVYEPLLNARLGRVNGATCDGQIGVMAACRYQGLFFLLTAPNEIGSGHDVFLRDQLAQDNSVWSICAWHKTMREMQVGGKPDEVNWAVYEECRQGGAMIATAHEHSYSRTKTLSSTINQTVHPDWPDPDNLLVAPDATFVFVSDLGGDSIRDQSRCLPFTYTYGCNGEWASIYTSNQSANYGALFITFHVDGQPDKARGYFKNIDGVVVDTFDITSASLPPATPTGLTVAPGDQTLSLDWSDNTEPDLGGYNVYRSTLPGGPYQKRNASLLPTSDYVDTGLTNGVTQYYVVTAQNADNLESAYSTETSATPSGVLAPTVETDPVPHSGDAADDIAIWVHPSDVNQSTVIGTDKQGGIAVYDLAGSQLQFRSDGDMNNVDLRYNFPLGGESVALVTAGNRSNDSIAIYRVNDATRLLEEVAARTIDAGLSVVYGSCMYHSPVDGKYYFIVGDKSGNTKQWELFDDGTGKVDAVSVRSFDVGGQTEGCVADDENADLYIGEETSGIWKYGAEPGDGTARTKVDSTGSSGNLTADVEGLALYYASGGAGLLLASSQGSNDFAIYRREGNNDYVGSFPVPSGNGIDGVNHTDGIDVTGFGLGSAFPAGVFIVQDDSNSGGNQNYKLVPWEAIANQFGITIDTTWDPRLVGYIDPPDSSFDLAITSVVPNPASVVAGEIVLADVTVANLGTQDITVDISVDLAQPPTVIGSATVAGGLAAGTSTTVSIPWDTTGANPGDHTLEASHDFFDMTPFNNLDTAVVTVNPAPGSPVTVSFQEGMNSYSGMVDTFLFETEPDTPQGANNVVEWDAGNGSDQISLFRFDNIFGAGAGQIPPGAAINSATFTYNVNNVGNPGQVNEVAIDWNEAVTYNSFGGTPGVQAGELGVSLGTATGDLVGLHSFNVTASLAAWVGNPGGNRGWIVQPTGSNGVQFRSRENIIIADRPILTVEYVNSIVTDLAITSVVPDSSNVVEG